MKGVKKLSYFVNGKTVESKTGNYDGCYNPGTGEIIARTLCCAKNEVESAIAAAKAAYPARPGTPGLKRARVLYKRRAA
jgi:acyl-CoA reductase-like NAD-dependent aldehyde dehydrogenase